VKINRQDADATTDLQKSGANSEVRADEVEEISILR
jgi:hypothetical protein